MDTDLTSRYFEGSANFLFRRCVQCPDEQPGCPSSCPSGQECVLVSKTCNACASSKCAATPGSSSSSSSSESSPAGPIAGGVIGGIALVVIVVGLLWYFYIRKRRQQEPDTHTQLADLKAQYADEEEKPESSQPSYTERSSKRGSTRSVFTTRSNVIPIAYIPGVTGTATASPEMVPPVPPIPAAGTTSPHLNNGTELFFSSHDLRPESTYSAKPGYARSVARSSIAASEYQAEVAQMPAARQAYAARAVPISVSSQSRVASPTHSPPLSHQNSIAGRMNNRPAMNGQSGQARQVMITRSQSNLGKGFAHEMEDTSPAPTPRIGIDRSGTASPRSMLSDDAASAHSARYMGGRSPGSPQPPVSAVRSEFSQNGASPVSNFGWDQNHSNIRNTIRDAALLGYGQQPQHTLTEIAELDGDTHSQISEGRSPFADRHATRTP